MKVTLPYDTQWLALKWAKVNCPSYITNQGENIGLDVYVIHYFFGQQRDATAFALRWA